MKLKNIVEVVTKRFVQPFFRKLVGMNEYEEQIESLNYILNKGIDITKFPHATGVLRSVQKADAELLRIFGEICNKHNLIYWLDHGTLLGAVRHKGFIPWDDDLDVAMPRNHFNKLCNILSEELKDYKIEFIIERRAALMLWKAGVIMDIFPIDNVSKTAVINEDDLRKKLQRLRKYYKRKAGGNLIKAKKRILGEDGEHNSFWYHNVEICGGKTVFDEETIFPLKEISFEGYNYPIPNDSDKYLVELYGNYMDFPKKGILHHNATNNHIFENAIKNAVDMDDVISYLKSIKISGN